MVPGVPAMAGQPTAMSRVVGPGGMMVNSSVGMPYPAGPYNPVPNMKGPPMPVRMATVVPSAIEGADGAEVSQLEPWAAWAATLLGADEL